MQVIRLPDPVTGLKSSNEALGLVNLIFGGAVLGVFFVPVLDERLRLFLWPHAAAFCAGLIMPRVFLKLLSATRRVVYMFLGMATASLTLTWHAFVGGLLGFGVSVGIPESGIFVFAAPLVMLSVFLVVYLEVLAGSKCWKHATKCHRIDLEHAVFRHQVPPPLLPSSVGRQELIVRTIVTVAALAVYLRNGWGTVTAMTIAGIGSLITVFVFLPQALDDISMLIRILSWERATGRKILIEEPPDDASGTGSEQPEC